MADNFRELATFVIGLTVLGGSGVLIFTARGTEEQAWLMIGIVVAYFFNRQQQSSAVRDVMNSQPTTTLTAGPPPTATVTPPNNDHSDDAPILNTRGPG